MNTVEKIKEIKNKYRTDLPHPINCNCVNCQIVDDLNVILAELEAEKCVCKTCGGRKETFHEIKDINSVYGIRGNAPCPDCNGTGQSTPDEYVNGRNVGGEECDCQKQDVATEIKAVFCDKKFDMCPTVRSAGLELLDIINRQAKEIEQMKRLVTKAMETDLQNLTWLKENIELVKENAPLKEALAKINKYSFCQDCRNIAEQALKGGEQ